MDRNTTVKAGSRLINSRREPARGRGIVALWKGAPAVLRRVRVASMPFDSSSARRGGDGFTAEITGAEARRQLRMSAAVVAMIAAGIVSAAVAVGPSPAGARRGVASVRPVVTLHAETAPVGARAI